MFTPLRLLLARPRAHAGVESAEHRARIGGDVLHLRGLDLPRVVLHATSLARQNPAGLRGFHAMRGQALRMAPRTPTR